TWTRRRPDACSASMIFMQSSAVVASGFSQNTGLRAATAASTDAACAGPQEATSTATTSPAPTTSRSEAAERPPPDAATAAARPGAMPVTTATRAPPTAVPILRASSAPIIPAPTRPTLRGMRYFLSFRGGRPRAGPDAPGLQRAGEHPERRDRRGGGCGSAAELVLQGVQFGAARHVVGEVVQGQLGAGRVQLHLAQAQHREVVADHVGVVRVVRDEHDAQPGLPGGPHVLEHHPGLLDAERGGGLVQDEHPGA